MANADRVRSDLAYGTPQYGGIVVPFTGQPWFVDPNYAVNAAGRSRAKGHGKTGDYPLPLLETAESRSESGDVIFIQGNIREEDVTFSNLKFDRKVVGLFGLHHPDQPTSAYHPKGSMIRPPASPTATTPLVVVRGRGTQFHNVAFDCPVDAAAVKLVRNASSGADEYDSSHAIFDGCRFTDGLIGIENSGGASFVKVRRSRFVRMSGSGGAAIKCTSTSVAVPLEWEIEDSKFIHNASHILSSMSYSVIRRNIFGRFTATLSIDIDDQPSANQGEYNVITENYLSGTFGVTAYPAGSNNEWAGNQNVAGVTTADPT